MLENNINYKCGQLFYLAEMIQELGNGSVKINCNVTDKYWGNFIIAPNKSFASIDQIVKFSLKKLKREKPGYAVMLDKEYRQLIVDIGTIPGRLTVEEQAMVVVGYHSRCQERWTKKSEPEVTESA